MTDLERLVKVRRLVANGEARRLRQNTKTSLSEIAEACRVHTGTVWKWETRRARPTGDAALRYLDALEALAEPQSDAQAALPVAS